MDAPSSPYPYVDLIFQDAVGFPQGDWDQVHEYQHELHPHKKEGIPGPVGTLHHNQLLPHPFQRRPLWYQRFQLTFHPTICNLVREEVSQPAIRLFLKSSYLNLILLLAIRPTISWKFSIVGEGKIFGRELIDQRS